jgi:hypothetical protein
MTTTSNIRTTTRIGLIAMALAFGASSMSPAFARGGEAGGGAGANPMQIAAQNIAVPPKAKPKKVSVKRSMKTCGDIVANGSSCTVVVSAR